jgi:hypothetical protein
VGIDAVEVFVGQRPHQFAERRGRDHVVEPAAPATTVASEQHAFGEMSAEALERPARPRVMQFRLSAARADRHHDRQL